MLKRLLMLSLASLALLIGLRAMVVRAEQPVHVASPAARASWVAPALPKDAITPAAPRVRAVFTLCPSRMPQSAFRQFPAADANGVPVADAPYYRAAYSAFHLPDTSG